MIVVFGPDSATEAISKTQEPHPCVCIMNTRPPPLALVRFKEQKIELVETRIQATGMQVVAEALCDVGVKIWGRPLSAEPWG